MTNSQLSYRYVCKVFCAMLFLLLLLLCCWFFAGKIKKCKRILFLVFGTSLLFIIYTSHPRRPELISYLKEDRVTVQLFMDIIHELPQHIEESLPSKELMLYTSHLYKSEKEDYVLFLIGAGPTVYQSNAIVGCGVGNRTGYKYKVRYVYEDTRLHRWQEMLKEKRHHYQQLVVECYGVQVEKGDPGFLLYNNSTSDKIVAIFTEQPIVIPLPPVRSVQDNVVSSVVCTKVLSRNVSWLPEFLRYQKTLGVDHIHLSILDTFIKDGGFRDRLEKDSFFIKAVQENYITVHIWKERYNQTEWFYYGNIFMYLDCIYRYRGTYDFVSLWDTDDFFTIRVPGMSYKDFLLTHCYKEGVGSCSFKWLFYYPDICGLRKKVGEDGNVTDCINPHSPRNAQIGNYKSVHLSMAVRDSSFHDASCNSCLTKGYRAILVPSRIAYVAHNRLNSNFSSSICKH